MDGIVRILVFREHEKDGKPMKEAEDKTER